MTWKTWADVPNEYKSELLNKQGPGEYGFNPDGTQGYQYGAYQQYEPTSSAGYVASRTNDAEMSALINSDPGARIGDQYDSIRNWQWAQGGPEYNVLGDYGLQKNPDGSFQARPDNTYRDLAVLVAAGFGGAALGQAFGGVGGALGASEAGSAALGDAATASAWGEGAGLGMDTVGAVGGSEGAAWGGSAFLLAAIVSFIGAPHMKDEDIAELQKVPKLIAEARAVDNLPKLFQKELISVAVASRFNFPAPGPIQAKTAQEHFDKRFQIVVASNVTAIPKPE